MNGSNPLSYNLIDEPWLSVRTNTGQREELSLTEVFRRAHELAAVLGDVPTQVFALTRLLLAVLHRAVDGPRDLDAWEQLWQQPELPAQQIGEYLHQHRDRFDLLSPQAPFFQVAGLHTAKGEVSELGKLIADVPNGHPFFTNRLGAILSLSFAEAARWLVHCQAFDPSGIKSGAVGDKRVKGGKGYPIGTAWSGHLGGVIPEGATLRETLLLNLIAYDQHGLTATPETDLPAWERDPVGVGEELDGGRAPCGRVDLYTWQSRRILLSYTTSAVTGVLICNGERLTPQNKHHHEPHTAWRRSTPQEKKHGLPLVYMPREHLPDRAVWRGLASLLPAAQRPQGQDAAAALTPQVLEWIARLGNEIDPDLPVRLHTIGMTYGAQSSTTEDILDDQLPLHAILLHREATDLAATAVACVQAAEETAKAVGRLAGNLAAAAGCGRDERDGPVTRAREQVFAALDPLFRAWLRDLDATTDPMAAHQAWQRQARQCAQAVAADLLARAPMTAWRGRTVDARLMNTPLADKRFRRDLHTALPLAAQTIEVAS
ncbi:type I-E CRISPR-associated protein Cse1/CasA [Crossiella sp. CA-258035]|uniref:type I-E CRISPR-associated protein Cse1/CasA n=1 Tax=Crossiella sp. CA-258035 TaxID=2981138 RepID=UPI0024BD43FA|nr:type I-E CRISPR-associated protein Cse1/CasA [Crossiella sp. CA-258035]WHT23394.1 type I-E CRISPR-associated protein Cse1/CasA [Crossiella sp. CA-258035]